MEEKKTAKPDRDRDIDWGWIGHTTDHFSEVLFELTKVADSLKSCADSLDYKEGAGKPRGFDASHRARG